MPQSPSTPLQHSKTRQHCYSTAKPVSAATTQQGPSGSLQQSTTCNDRRRNRRPGISAVTHVTRGAPRAVRRRAADAPSAPRAFSAPAMAPHTLAHTHANALKHAVAHATSLAERRSESAKNRPSRYAIYRCCGRSAAIHLRIAAIRLRPALRLCVRLDLRVDLRPTCRQASRSVGAGERGI